MSIYSDTIRKLLDTVIEVGRILKIELPFHQSYILQLKTEASKFKDV